MIQLTNTSTLWELAHTYGQPPARDEDGEIIGKDHSNYGVLSDHLHLCEDNPHVIVRRSGNRAFVCAVEFPFDDEMEAAVPVLCSEIISIYTEDGSSTGRCGQPAVDEYGCCAVHAPELV